MQVYRYYIAHLGVSRHPQVLLRGLTADRLAGLAFSPKASALSIMSVSPSTRETTPDSQISSLSACLRHRRRLGQAVRETPGNCQRGVFSNRSMIGEPDAGWRVKRRREREGLEVLSLSPDPSVRLSVGSLYTGGAKSGADVYLRSSEERCGRPDGIRTHDLRLSTRHVGT